VGLVSMPDVATDLSQHELTAPPQSWNVPRAGVARGELVEERIVSKILKSERQKPQRMQRISCLT